MNGLTFFCLIAFLAGLMLLTNWTKWFGSVEAKSWAARDEWIRQRRAQGATFDEINAEGHLREELARLRRICSDAVHTLPNGREAWVEVMKREIQSSVHVMNVLDPALGRQFLKIVSNLEHSDILYPDAYDVVYPPPKVIPLDRARRQALAHDRLAAFTDL